MYNIREKIIIITADLVVVGPSSGGNDSDTEVANDEDMLEIRELPNEISGEDVMYEKPEESDDEMLDDKVPPKRANVSDTVQWKKKDIQIEGDSVKTTKRTTR